MLHNGIGTISLSHPLEEEELEANMALLLQRSSICIYVHSFVHTTTIISLVHLEPRKNK